MNQDAIVWLYFAAFLFVVLPYLIIRLRAFAQRAAWRSAYAARFAGRPRFPR